MGRLLMKDGKPVAQSKTPNLGGAMTPRLLVMHYTAAQSAKGAISWLCNPAAKASAHLVIDEYGAVTQLAPFNRVTWHAGRRVEMAHGLQFLLDRNRTLQSGSFDETRQRQIRRQYRQERARR